MEDLLEYDNKMGLKGKRQRMCRLASFNTARGSVPASGEITGSMRGGYD